MQKHASSEEITVLKNASKSKDEDTNLQREKRGHFSPGKDGDGVGVHGRAVLSLEKKNHLVCKKRRGRGLSISKARRKGTCTEREERGETGHYRASFNAREQLRSKNAVTGQTRHS